MWKTMENSRNRINIKLVSNEKDYLKWTFKTSYMSHKIFGNDLVAIRQSKKHKIGTCEIDKISLSCFDDKVYIQNNGCDELVSGYQS